MVYGSKRLCLTSSLERPFRCLDFFNFVNLIDLILGAPLTMGGKMFNPLRLSAIVPSDPCIFNPLNLSVSEIFHLFPKLDASNSSFFFLRPLAFLFYGMRCPQYWESKQDSFLCVKQSVPIHPIYHHRAKMRDTSTL